MGSGSSSRTQTPEWVVFRNSSNTPIPIFVLRSSLSLSLSSLSLSLSLSDPSLFLRRRWKSLHSLDFFKSNTRRRLFHISTALAGATIIAQEERKSRKCTKLNENDGARNKNQGEHEHNNKKQTAVRSSSGVFRSRVEMAQLWWNLAFHELRARGISLARGYDILLW